MADPVETKEVFNHDVVFVVDLVDRFREELAGSQSSSGSGMIPADRARAVSYLTALDAAHVWIKGQPQLDLPETHPRKYVLEEIKPAPDSESEEINMLDRLLHSLRNELINSQSARLASTLTIHDSKRFTDIVAKARAFIEAYVDTQTPLDLPESSPREVMTAPGRGGV